MTSFLFKWVVNILALCLVVNIVAGVSAQSWQTLAAAALLLGLLNTFIRPILIFLTLPLNILTLGFFTLIINGFLFYAASKLIRGFVVANFWSAFWAALLLSLISFILNIFIQPPVLTKHILYARSRTGSPHGKDNDYIDIEGRPEK